MDRENRDEGFGDERHSSRGGDRDEGPRIKSSYFLPKPVKVGDEVEVKIEAVASRGDGIAKKDGFVIFVKGAKQGETVKAKVVDVKARFAIAEPVE
ncbi:MAG: TRAM domain-containing protein [Candidatus Marsarchaeota archaeon]|jgi:23S rRNA (uridine2552-2'-O)-methyltransferase|nr:TRAM domain-containing protein [Candidatus Marsarchaeota archaeon]